MITDTLNQILKELQKLNESKQEKLWKIEDIEVYCSMSRATVDQKIISCSDFPRPISINNTHPRWIAEEVKSWMKRKRG